jgi:hypothetical protein
MNSPLRCLADLPQQPSQWLWPGRIPRAALTLLCGDAGRGKSLLSLDIAARVTSGQPWPDGAAPEQPADVLLLSAEDSIGRTVRSRLIAHGADLRRVYYLNSGIWMEPTAPLTPPVKPDGIIAYTTFGNMHIHASHALYRDARQIKDALEALPECRLVVMDPMSAYFKPGRIDDPEHAREFLAPLATFADRTGAAVIAVVHRDHAMRRPTDRRHYPLRALADMARAIYLIDRHPDFPGTTAMLPVKNNFGDSSSALAFTITAESHEAGRIQWRPEPLELTGDEVQADARSNHSRPPRLLEIDRAVAWLKGALAAGPVFTSELEARAAQAGVTERTLRRARNLLRVKTFRQAATEGGRWLCALPGENCSPNDQVGQKSHLADMANLAELADLVAPQDTDALLAFLRSPPPTAPTTRAPNAAPKPAA